MYQTDAHRLDAGRSDFVPYSPAGQRSNDPYAGSKIQGPQLAKMVDPRGLKYGDVTQHPDYQRRRGQRAIAVE